MIKKLGKKTLWWIWITVGLKVGIIAIIVLGALEAAHQVHQAVVAMLAGEAAAETSETEDNRLVLEYEVMRWHQEVTYWANHYGIGDWVIELLAIMHVETGGRHADLMQSSGATRFSISA